MSIDPVAALNWPPDGLLPAIAQDAATGEVLMQAWMDREAFATTLREGYACYWSRSRRRLWRKGETSGHRQRVIEVRTDCDRDCILLKVEQVGGIACHTGRRSCFHERLDDDGWTVVEPVVGQRGEEP